MSQDEFRTALKILTEPKHTNHEGTVFGGVILSGIDQAGYVEARRHGLHRWVTVALEKVVFVAPVLVGDVVNFNSRTVSTGTSSVTIEVHVDAERFTTGKTVAVTKATLTMISVGPDGRPIPFSSPPTSAWASQGNRQ